MFTVVRSALLFCVLLVSLNVASAGKFNRQLSVGDIAPAWESLPGVDDARHSFKDLRDAKLAAVVFACNHCPIMKSYEPILIDLQKQYADRGVRVVAISCSLYEGDLLPAMKERAKTAGWNFPYLHDESQKIGRAYGATATPQVFVLQPNRTLVYTGAIDNGMGKPSQADKHYLRDALDALLAGREPEVTETRAIGCGIVYEEE